MRKAIEYQGVSLMPGSTAHQLHVDGKMKELAAHMKRLDDEDRKRSGLPPRQPEVRT